MDVQHRCEPLDVMNSSAAFQCRIMRNGSQWYLMTVGFALDADVTAGEAEEVGETLSTSELAISYCPFCGSLLAKAPC